MTKGNRIKELALRAKLEATAIELANIVKELRRVDLVPMSYVMSKVPGETIIEKMEKIGVSRQTYYFWMRGRSRPSPRQAERLAELTGIPIGDIRLLEEST